MTTGRAPYDEQDDLHSVMRARLVGDPVAPRAHRPAIVPEVEEIILHALARDPEDRYPTAAAMKAELVAPDRVEVTGRANRLKAPSPGERHWRAPLIVVIALAVPVLLFFLFLYILKR
jgi:serine/threonine-protein kinase